MNLPNVQQSLQNLTSALIVEVAEPMSDKHYSPNHAIPPVLIVSPEKASLMVEEARALGIDPNKYLEGVIERGLNNPLQLG